MNLQKVFLNLQKVKIRKPSTTKHMLKENTRLSRNVMFTFIACVGVGKNIT